LIEWGVDRLIGVGADFEREMNKSDEQNTYNI
jgi:hypothetical protein